jgi:hypothetical protein
MALPFELDGHAHEDAERRSDEQGYPAGNRGEKSEAVYEDFCKCYDLAMLASSYWPELQGSWGGTVSERLTVTLTAEHSARSEAEERGYALREALRGLVEAVESEYGEQPDVPELVAAKALLQ